MTPIQTRLHQTHQRIFQAACRAGRRPARLLVITKARPAHMVKEAWEAGHKAFGEGYVLEGLHKIQQLSCLPDLEWHFTGKLQSNKTRLVAQNFDWMHSLDQIKTAHRLNSQRSSSLAPLNLCLQVNIDNQPTKSGVHPSEVISLAQQLITLPALKLRGLMAIPAPQDDPEQQRPAFRAMRSLFDDLHAQFPEQQLDTLSMGMSADMEVAIEEGATLVRIGTAIMGAPEVPPG
ncbi:MAG: YggS family pyridoxal phosphate-dependent enzyme [Kistimonas sp.]|nr:YggS family pyridoxal phosphate-dependent enzyme [Kistimonas sp.]